MSESMFVDPHKAGSPSSGGVFSPPVWLVLNLPRLDSILVVTNHQLSMDGDPLQIEGSVGVGLQSLRKHTLIAASYHRDDTYPSTRKSIDEIIHRPLSVRFLKQLVKRFFRHWEGFEVFPREPASDEVDTCVDEYISQSGHSST